MNRKGGRAAQTGVANTGGISDVSQIPMQAPPPSGRNNPKGKTLIELAAEREAALRAKMGKPAISSPAVPKDKTEFLKIGPDGKIVREDGTALPSEKEQIDEEMPPLPDTILLSFPLAAIHLILSYVAMLQYAEDLDYAALFIRSGIIAFPTLTLAIHFAHGHIISFEPLKRLYKWKPAKGKGRMFKPGEKYEELQPTLLQQIWSSTLRVCQALLPLTPNTFIFLPLAVYFGARLIQTTNEKLYYANMKTAPSLGTLWVWAIIELRVGPAIIAFIIPIYWAKYYKHYALW
ncbi:hypothetical protein KEM54_001901 [Ascosphaera aggregata]|nr:hypothetical protein KEM54_001901 [Ascosphaera aggregata]